jgi:hypothetical protein
MTVGQTISYIMKKDFEKCKLKELSSQAIEVLEHHKGFMQYVKNQKQAVVKFNEITAVKVRKKKKGNNFS